MRRRWRAQDTRRIELEQYPLAEHYLQDAVKRDPNDTDSAERLKTTEMVLRMDPYQRQISSDRTRSIGHRSVYHCGRKIAALRGTQRRWRGWGRCAGGKPERRVVGVETADHDTRFAKKFRAWRIRRWIWCSESSGKRA